MEPELTCTRAEANYEQLFNCKTTLGKLNGSFEQMTKLLSIAGNEVRLKILFLLDMEKELCPCPSLLEIINPASFIFRR